MTLESFACFLTAKLLIAGLALGLHGANATGRPFTKDYAGSCFMEHFLSLVTVIN